MVLSAKDKAVIAAFLEPDKKRSASSKHLSTDGMRLDGNWMGGRGIAVWKSGGIALGDLGGTTSQTVQRALIKAAPKAWLTAYNPWLYKRNPSSGAKQPKPKFDLGDLVEIIDRLQGGGVRVYDTGEVSYISGYTAPPYGGWRYKVLTPSGSRLTYNEASLRKAKSPKRDL